MATIPEGTGDAPKKGALHDLAGVEAALLRAGQQARRIAVQTQTVLVVSAHSTLAQRIVIKSKQA
jgi:hypothetical protein